VILQGYVHGTAQSRKLLAEQDSTAEKPLVHEGSILDGLAAAISVWYNYTGTLILPLFFFLLHNTLFMRAYKLLVSCAYHAVHTSFKV
jgi:hypothetical protein